MKLWVGWQFEALAECLVERIRETRTPGHPFIAPLVVPPTRAARGWLQLFLARRQGVCANIRFDYLETAVWDMLSGLRKAGAPQVVRLTVDHLRAMILSILTADDADALLQPMRSYIGENDGGQAFHRKARQLSDQLARKFEEYEFHRSDMLAAWLTHDPAGSDSDDPILAAERVLYRQIIALGGLRDGLGAFRPRLLNMTEYAAGALAEPISLDHPPPVFIFGLAHVSPLHVGLLKELAAHYPIEILLQTPLGVRARTAAELIAATANDAVGDDPLALWGRASIRALRRLEPLIGEAGSKNVTFVPGHAESVTTIGKNAAKAQAAIGGVSRTTSTLLHSLQNRALGRSLPPLQKQDGSLLVLECPSVFREAESVYQNILRDLNDDPSLKPADIAVLVTDMALYRPALQSAFTADRGGAVPFTLRDFPARQASQFASAVEQLIELAEGRFPRAEVCDLLLNPCFLARAGADVEEGSQWVRWARKLNICHSYDSKSKAAEGYSDSSAFTWELGLRRLRMGYLFHQSAEDDALADAFDGAVSFADMQSGDPDAAGRFCETIERLYQRLGPLRKMQLTAAEWRGRFRELIDDFLAVPSEDPAETGMHRQVTSALDSLADLDPIRAALNQPKEFGMPLVRQHLFDSITSVKGILGRAQTGGVLICELASARPLAFKHIYVLGLGEGDFPGREIPTAIDLMSRDSRPTDIALPDINRELFLDCLLAAREKLCLSYVSRDLEKDRRKYPSSVLSELLRITRQQIVGGEFRTTEVPLTGSDARYLSVAAPAEGLVNFSAYERVTCLLDLQNRGKIQLNGQLTNWERKHRPDNTATKMGRGAEPLPTATLRLGQLKKFLQDPLAEAVKRHLRLFDIEPEAPWDDEPFYSVFPTDWRCKDTALKRFTAKALAKGIAAAMNDFDKDFDDYFSGLARTGHAPEGIFGKLDAARIRADVRRIIGNLENSKLAKLLAARGGSKQISAVAIGTGRGAADAVRYPALDLTMGNGTSVQLSGDGVFLFEHDGAIESLAITTKTSIKNGTFVHHALDGLLLLLALRANDAQGKLSSSAWFGDRPFRVLASHGEGIAKFEYDPISPDDARKYMAGLCQAYLNAGSFELFPFDVVMAEMPDGPVAFEQRMQSKLDALRDSLYDLNKPDDMQRLIDPKMPADAWNVALTRFGLPLSFKKGG